MLHPTQRTGALALVLGGACVAAAAAEFATVVSATPVSAAVPVLRQKCFDSQALVQTQPSGAGALLGAIAGGVIGHNLGSGFGRAAATGVGAITGSVIGNQVEANATPPLDVPVRRCRSVTRTEERVLGYDVMYEVAGQRYSTRMARDPGRQFEVTMQSADAGGASVPAPADASLMAAAAPAPTPTPVYYQPVPGPVYYDYATAPPLVYVAPFIGFGYYGGGYRSYRRWR